MILKKLVACSIKGNIERFVAAYQCCLSIIQFPHLMLSSDLLLAYQQTHYHIHCEPSFYLVPGKYCAELVELHRRFEANSSAFVTAWNPYSQMQSQEENGKRNQELLELISEMEYPYINGQGLHPSGNWPGEDSFLVLDIDRASAKSLGKSLEQNAIVFSDISAIPEIVVLV